MLKVSQCLRGVAQLQVRNAQVEPRIQIIGVCGQGRGEIAGCRIVSLVQEVRYAAQVDDMPVARAQLLR